MNTQISPELFWLIGVTLFTSTLWIPYILQLIAQTGLSFAVWDPYHETPHEAKWAQRAKRAHTNAVENLVVFAPLTIGLHLTGLGNEITAAACAIFFFARVGHYAVYTLGLPVIRTLLFAVGFGCQAYLGLVLLQLL